MRICPMTNRLWLISHGNKVDFSHTVLQFWIDSIPSRIHRSWVLLEHTRGLYSELFSHRLKRYWSRILDTKYIGDDLAALVTNIKFWWTILSQQDIVSSTPRDHTDKSAQFFEISVWDKVLPFNVWCSGRRLHPNVPPLGRL